MHICRLVKSLASVGAWSNFYFVFIKTTAKFFFLKKKSTVCKSMDTMSVLVWLFCQHSFGVLCQNLFRYYANICLGYYISICLGIISAFVWVLCQDFWGYYVSTC